MMADQQPMSDADRTGDRDTLAERIARLEAEASVR